MILSIALISLSYQFIMSNNGDQYFIPNFHEPSKPLTVITSNNSIKLTTTNYLAWKTWIEAILIGFDVYRFIDGAIPCPLSTITSDYTTTANLAYSPWVRQDKLIFGALVGTLTRTLVPLISQASTSRAAWKTLASTYASPSRDHINQLKDRLCNKIKSPTQSITEYMQPIKACIDQLALLGKAINPKDIVEKVLKGLDHEVFKPIIDVVNARDTPIIFKSFLRNLLISNLLSKINKALTTHLSQPPFMQLTLDCSTRIVPRAHRIMAYFPPLHMVPLHIYQKFIPFEENSKGLNFIWFFWNFWACMSIVN